jgi:cell division protein FtsW (lipid II flippase)
MNTTETTKIALTPTSYKASIITCWILIFLWVVVVLAVVIISVMVVSTNAYETWERLAGYLEIPFEVAEICVLMVLAFKCRKQRQRTLAELSVDRRTTAV